MTREQDRHMQGEVVYELSQRSDPEPRGVLLDLVNRRDGEQEVDPRTAECFMSWPNLCAVAMVDLSQSRGVLILDSGLRLPWTARANADPPLHVQGPMLFAAPIAVADGLRRTYPEDIFDVGTTPSVPERTHVHLWGHGFASEQYTVHIQVSHTEPSPGARRLGGNSGRTAGQ